MEEESKDDQDSHSIIGSYIKERLDTNSEVVLQNSGYAGMYGIQEHSQTYSEARVSEHSLVAVENIIDFTSSPNSSPSTNQANLIIGQIDTFQIDTTEAIIEDVDQQVSTFKEGIGQIVTDLAAGGTLMSHDDDLNDLFF
jgi:hypothetical protein